MSYLHLSSAQSFLVLLMNCPSGFLSSVLKNQGSVWPSVV